MPCCGPPSSPTLAPTHTLTLACRRWRALATLGGTQVVKVNDHHQLTLLGGEDGHVEFWDPRVRRSLGRLDVGGEVMRQFNECGRV